MTTPINVRIAEPDAAHVERIAERLIQDRTPGAIHAPASELRELAFVVAQAKADGANPRTLSKDESAWKQFEEYANKRGFDPNLQSSWAERFPERESLKLAGFLLYAAQQIKRRSKADPSAKPLCVYQRYLALPRIFKRREVVLPMTTTVRDTLKGVLQRLVRDHGIEAPQQRRTEPITLYIVRQLIRPTREGNKRVRGVRWSLANWDCFIITAWEVINLSASTRKGEPALPPGDRNTTVTGTPVTRSPTTSRGARGLTPQKTCCFPWQRGTLLPLSPRKRRNASSTVPVMGLTP